MQNKQDLLGVSSQCQSDGVIEYEFPCYNFLETPNMAEMWKRDEPGFEDAVYGGVLLKTRHD